MGVIPVGADLIRDEAIDIFLPRQHRILGHAGHAVDTIGHIQSVPVQGRTIDDVRVPQDDLDQIALDGLDGRSGEEPFRVKPGRVRPSARCTSPCRATSSTRTSAARTGSTTSPVIDTPGCPAGAPAAPCAPWPGSAPEADSGPPPQSGVPIAMAEK